MRTGRSPHRRYSNEPMQEPLPQYVSPGHFCSPVPSADDLARAVAAVANPGPVLGIDMREAEQLAFLERLSRYYPEVQFPENNDGNTRFAFNNPSYSWCDAIILFCMLRELRPRRIIEVGSGYTSCLILDVNELYFDWGIDCTFIEPYAELLRSLLKPQDADRVHLVASKLQDVETTLFKTLEAGDILFIDSSHVVKAGSDVLTLFANILPQLNVSTFIHFHDVFDRFEYPTEWLMQGRGWNEQYFLRVFLQYNSSFRIKLFTPHMITRYGDWFRERMPDCFKNTGGHIWIERVG
jgi:Methyltransferase domain